MTKKSKKINKESEELCNKVENVLDLHLNIDYEAILLEFFNNLNTVAPFKYMFFCLSPSYYADGDISSPYIDSIIMFFEHNTYSSEGYIFDQYYDENEIEYTPNYFDEKEIITHLNKVFSWGFSNFDTIPEDAPSDISICTKDSSVNIEKITYKLTKKLEKILIGLVGGEEHKLICIKNINGVISVNTYSSCQYFD